MDRGGQDSLEQPPSMSGEKAVGRLQRTSVPGRGQHLWGFSPGCLCILCVAGWKDTSEGQEGLTD